ncbi:UTRA domain-containing protein [Staphylococcus chromogenes]|uniref:UTRA domain-containing protein n=1 Tax=Staphylococcus chromogenes TaxID=46126 RepID=UPI0021D07096|nr:UTRA domain-containing protein [Staphylococcus chromogenes]UXS67971.1 UTRA domain-containing protein [Staphylococcus chromogenes]
MHKSESIYLDLKEKIEREIYPYNSYIPSENTLTEIYSCSRNTLRKAIESLILEGYLNAKHGKGVKVVYHSFKGTRFLIGGFESFEEACNRNHVTHSTKVLEFKEMTIENSIHEFSLIDPGTRVYYIKRLRFVSNQPTILDINYFVKDVIGHLTRDVAETSIYNYIDASKNIKMSKHLFSVELATDEEKKLLNLKDYNSVATIRNNIFNKNGELMEFTISKHNPENFEYYNVSLNK